ncbi:MAG: hypothetical protein JXA66_01380 [Oligoflexia bacterium]|nr:hypothetical protein [Oligoflexia bacterium]
MRLFKKRDKSSKPQFDKNLVDLNLTYSYQKRLELHEKARALASLIAAAGKKINGKSE